MRLKLGALGLALVIAAIGARAAGGYTDPFVTTTIAATDITTCDGISNVTLTVQGNQLSSATSLHYAVTAGAGWSVAAASATGGTTVHTPSTIDWSLPILGSGTVVIHYSLLHTATTNGAAVPLHSHATFTATEPTGPLSVYYDTTAVSVTGCNTPPHANAGPDQTVFVSPVGQPIASVLLDGSGSSDDGLLGPLTYTWSEGGSTIATGVSPTVPLLYGVHNLLLTVDDGQFTDTDGLQVTVNDPTPPIIVPHVSGTFGNNSWYVSNVNVSWTVTDPESPGTLVTSGCGPVTHTTDGTSISYVCSATSGGGTSSQTVTFKRDTVLPVITFTGNVTPYTVDQTVVINCAATDATSGVAFSTCVNTNQPASDFSLGPHTITMSATDNAGWVGTNSTTFSVTVTYASLCNLAIRWAGAKAGAALCSELTEAQKYNSVPAHKLEEINEFKALALKDAPTYLTLARANQLNAYTSGL
jgi:hypothetical protein